MRILSLAAAAALTVGALGAGAHAQTPSGYHLLKKIEVGGEGGWDYLLADADSHRLFVSHATKVVVIDTDAGKVVGEIPGTNGVHGIAIAHELNRGFTSNGRDNTVTIFDLQTLKAIATVPVGKNPDAILFDPFSKRVFTFNGRSSDATAIDAAKGTVLGTIALGGKPEFATTDKKGSVFVNIEDKNEVIHFDPMKLQVLHHWPIAPGEEASGMAIDLKHHRLFLVCSNKKMIVLDNESGKTVMDVPIGDGPDAAAFDPETKLAFSSNGAGSITVVREDSDKRFTVLDTVTTQRGARTMALDTKTHNLYLPAVQYGETPAATKDNPRPRPAVVPNSFVILVYGK